MESSLVIAEPVIASFEDMSLNGVRSPDPVFREQIIENGRSRRTRNNNPMNASYANFEDGDYDDDTRTVVNNSNSKNVAKKEVIEYINNYVAMKDDFESKTFEEMATDIGIGGFSRGKLSRIQAHIDDMMDALPQISTDVIENETIVGCKTVEDLDVAINQIESRITELKGIMKQAKQKKQSIINQCDEKRDTFVGLTTIIQQLRSNM